MSVREYAILYIGKGGKSGSTAGGGNVVLNAGQHKLDGVEHLAPDDTTRLDASTTKHGLLPKLSGTAGEFLDGLGDWTRPNLADLGDVDTYDLADGDALVWDDYLQQWVPGAGGGSITVEESDASPSVAGVDTLVFDAGDFSVTDNLDGSVTVASLGSGGGDATGQLVAIFDAGLAPVTAGDIAYLVAPYDGTITDYVILGDTTGNASFDVAEVAAGGSLPAFPGDSIVAAAPPSMTGAVQAASSTLTGWTTTITAGHLYAVKLATASALHWTSLTLNYTRT